MCMSPSTVCELIHRIVLTAYLGTSEARPERLLMQGFGQVAEPPSTTHISK